MDPLAEKYPAWSPYNYVMNNPLRMVDPDGKEICLVYDKDKKTCSQAYKAGMDTEQFKDNKDLYNFVVGLNTLYNIDIGKEVINTLVKSKERYQFSSEVSPQGAYAFAGGSDTFYMGGLGNEPMDSPRFEKIGHELFHAYQRDHIGNAFAQGIDIEVEACLYGYLITDRLSKDNELSIETLKGRDASDISLDYNESMNDLLRSFHSKKPFPMEGFNTAVRSFKEGSKQMGVYVNFMEFTYTQTRIPVISNLYKGVKR